MIRRLFRLTVSGLCLLSLLVSLGVAWLWWRNHHGGPERISFLRSGQRYTVRPRTGRLVLFGPPSPTDPAAEAKARQVAAAMRNSDIGGRARHSRQDVDRLDPESVEARPLDG